MKTYLISKDIIGFPGSRSFHFLYVDSIGGTSSIEKEPPPRSLLNSLMANERQEDDKLNLGFLGSEKLDGTVNLTFTLVIITTITNNSIL